MPFTQNWPISQECNKASGFCSVCNAKRQLHLSDGTVHLHGPRSNPCPGSNKPPGRFCSTSPSIISGELAYDNSQQSDTNARLSEHPVLKGPIIKHIPKSARLHCAQQLTLVIDNIIANTEDVNAWLRLLNFGNVMLLAPPRSGKKHNITALLKSRLSIDDFTDAVHLSSKRHIKSDLAALAASVTSKIEDGNVKAALRILVSEDKPAVDNDATFNALIARHPQANPNRRPSSPPEDYTPLQITEADIITIGRSFPAGSAGGPDGIRP